MSAGKTLVALRVAQLRGAQTVLVVAPLNTRTGWKNTAERMGITLPFHWLRESKAGSDAFTALAFDEPGIYFMGPEYAVTKAWDVAGHRTTPSGARKVIKRRNDFWSKYEPDLLIVDEIHRGTVNQSSQRYKTYMQMRAGFTLGLSGTPHGNEFQGIYGVTHMLWRDRTPVNITAFINEFCVTTYEPWAVFNGVGEFKKFERKYCREGHCKYDNHSHSVPGDEKNPGAYFASLPCVVRRVWEYEGVLDEQDVFVELTRDQRKAYTDLEKRMVTFMTGNPLVIELPQQLRIRLRQATLGMFHVTDEDSIEFANDCKSSKIDALFGAKGVLEDDFRGESALIATDSKRFAKVLVHRLNAAYPGSAEEWSGDVKPMERDDVKERFVSGATKYIVMVIKSGGTGTDGLQFGTRNVAWVSVDDSRVENIQFLARTVRRGQGDLVRVRHIIAVDTYDQGILSKQMQAAISMNKSMRLENS